MTFGQLDKGVQEPVLDISLVYLRIIILNIKNFEIAGDIRKNLRMCISDFRSYFQSRMIGKYLSVKELSKHLWSFLVYVAIKGQVK